VGATIDVALGGKYDDLHGAPLPLAAYVKCLTDGRFVRQALMGRGTHDDLGRMVRLHVGGLDILVSSVRQQTFDAEVFLLHGIDVTRYKIVALKSSNHFRAGFAPLAREIITADSPGLTTLRIERFPRRRNTQPLWPLDPGATYDA
jgi:microcystin degradation protein MlrC